MTLSFEQRIDKLEIDVMILTSKLDAVIREQKYYGNEKKTNE